MKHKAHDYIVFDADHLEVGDNGVMSFLANITRTGVFSYWEEGPDGRMRVIRRLRHPDEVFSEKAIASLQDLPVTNEHPLVEQERVLLSPEIASDFVVGMSSGTPKKVKAPFATDQEDYMQRRIAIWDKQTIADIKSGTKREFSLGYNIASYDATPGVWHGEAYDEVQRGLTYNHLSVVPKARGGANLKVVMDGADDIVINQHKVCDGIIIINKEKGKDMKIFVFDGKEVEVDDKAYDVLKKMKDDSDAKDVLLKDKQKALDTADGKIEALKSQVTEDQANQKTEEFDAAVNAKIVLLDSARKVLGSEEEIGHLSPRELKEKVIKKIRPDAIFDGKADGYVDGCFDQTVADFKPGPSAGERKVGKHMAADGAGERTYEQAKAEAAERDKNAWQKKA